MNCEELRASLEEHLAGRLPPARAAALRAHLASCPSCAGLVCTTSRVTCREVADFLHDYLEDELPAAQRATFQRHLELCPPCVDYLEAYRRTVTLAKDACTSEERPPLPDALVRAILAARKQRGGPRE